MNSNFLILNLPFPMHEPYVLFFGLSYYMSIPVCVVCKTVEKKKKGIQLISSVIYLNVDLLA